MSKVTIQGDASGTGIFTIASPNSNTDRTLVLPDEAGTVLTTASDVVQKGVPAFKVSVSLDQAVSSNTITKVAFDTVDVDTGGYYDATTNYRFTPQIAGYYMIVLSLTIDSDTTLTRHRSSIAKNGSQLYVTSATVSSPSFETHSSTSLFYMNGSTDYLEAYVYPVGTGNLVVKQSASS